MAKDLELFVYDEGRSIAHLNFFQMDRHAQKDALI